MNTQNENLNPEVKKERESGYYRIKHNDSWEIAEYNSDRLLWFRIAKSWGLLDTDLQEIDETPITRNPSNTEAESLLRDKEVIRFGLWLTQNCKPSTSKDGVVGVYPRQNMAHNRRMFSQIQRKSRGQSNISKITSFLGDNKDGK